MSLVHLHLMINHIPVIGTLFVILTLLAALRLRSSDMTRLGLLMLAGVGIVAVAVYFTGEPAEDAVENIAGVSRAVIHEHEEAAEVAFVTSAVAGALALLALWWTRRRELPRWIAGSALAIAVVVGGMMAWTASLGGNIRHTELRAGSAAGEVVPRDD